MTALAHYASNLKFEALPAPVIEKAKVCVLDLLGIAAAGFERDNAQVALKTARALGANGRATVWKTGERMRAVDAVLPNSVASHCILQDDWLQVSHSHIGAAVVPTALAMAEEENRSGRDVIEAVVAAYDVEDRAGSLSVPAFTRGFRVSGVYAYFGATAAAAKLGRLDNEQFTNALGCAGSMCGGLLQPWNEGSMEWSFQEAFASRAGITGMQLARDGLVGSRRIFEGSHGVNRSFSGTNENETVALDKLGSHFHIVDTCFKRFPTGGANQGSASVAYRLITRHHFDYRRVKSVTVDIPKAGSHERMNYAGIDYQGPYESIDHCLISKQFAIGVIFKTGDMTMPAVRANMKDEEMLALTRKIELRDAEDINGWNLRMRVELDDGTVFEGDGNDIDKAQLYLSWADAAEKFSKVTHGTLAPKAAQRIVELVGALESLGSVNEITALMKP
ncbi:MAG TPA: MmgE/PrpD family protein [Burkholderiales bacterium]|nr:MmgE/PrpD family protein [Burkholderiales bacterium]